ncbi:hypothetical protein [Microbacterium sp. A84]|uniref:hypothetical protein n=1 Tax=Microbacterium sp. A84 TaxID=3450715 RepID=UPI003F434ECE
MGVIGVPAERATFSLDRHVDLRGLVRREGIAQKLTQYRGSSIIELRGGAGWGKTAAALTYAAERRRSGAEVILIETDGNVRICPASDHAAVLYVLDDCSLTDAVMQELLTRVQGDDNVQILVCSRERHPFIRRAHSQALVTRSIHLNDFRMNAQDLREIARVRGIHLDTQRAEYVAHAAGGWPLVATGFLDLYAEGAGETSVAFIDQLVTRSFESVLSILLGDGALPLLARAALSDSVFRDAPQHSAESDALRSLIDRVHRLGLGEWVSR